MPAIDGVCEKKGSGLTSVTEGEEHYQQIFKGIFFGCLAFGCFAVMSMFNKLVTGQHHVVEVAFYRNIVAFLPYGFIVFALGKRHLLHSTQPKLLGARCVWGVMTLLFTLGAAQALPLADATVLFFISTLLIPLFAAIFLKEEIGIHRIIAIVIGMSGVLLVAQPSGDVTLIGVVLALSAGVGHAGMQTMLRGLRRQSPITVNFYFFLTGIILMGVAMPWFYNIPSAQSLLIMAGVGVAGIGGQLFLTLAYKYAPASVVSPFNYTGLLWASGFDILIWHTWPDMNVWAGAGLIMAASMYILYREHVNKKKRAGAGI